ncbi:MAG TPA: DUF167 domain-containing protein [Anaerolineae bacterium]|nr:DUF167 domain-containing protein [Anaerolineae bacterium]
MDQVIRESKRGVLLAVHIVPRSAKSELTGLHGRALRIRLAAPPVKGAANRELVRFLAKALAVSKGQIEIISGRTSRDKILAVSGSNRDAIDATLDKLLATDR